MKEKTQKRASLFLTLIFALAATLSGCSQPEGGVSTASLSNAAAESQSGSARQEAPSEPAAEPEEEPEQPSASEEAPSEPAAEPEEESEQPSANEEAPSEPITTPEDESGNTDNSQTAPVENIAAEETAASSTTDSQAAPSENSIAEEPLYVSFGDDGSPFVLHLYENDTAAAIARHVGTADWRLPIYHYDDYENWEVMQYYDIPSRYEIPSNPENVTKEQAGAVYYSEPNRIVLFYGDAEVSGEYTPVGYFDYTEEFVSAVANNPVLEGWGNKIVRISAQD